MALILIEGFPIGWTGPLSMPDGGAYYFGKWDVANIRTWGSAPPRHGNWSAISSSGSPTIMLQKTFPVADQDDYYVVGCGSLLYGGSQMNIVKLAGDGGATIHLSVRADSDGQLKVYRGDYGTLLAQGPYSTPVSTFQWHFIEIAARLHDTTGTATIYFDGQQVATYTGDTRNAGTSGLFDTVIFPTQSGLDDIYVLNEQGSVNNAPLGDCRVEQVFYSEGSNSQWVGSDGNSVNNPAHINYFNYGSSIPGWLQATADNQKDTYATSNPTVGANERLVGVEQWAWALKSDSGARTLGFTVLTGSGEVSSAGKPLVNGSLRKVNHVWDVDPTTGLPWTSASFNAAEFGMIAKP